MAKKPINETTGKKAASNAAKVLRDPKASTEAKSAAGSALTQVAKPGKPGKSPPGKKKN